jgi:cytochrome P450
MTENPTARVDGPTESDVDEALARYGRDIYNDFDFDDPAFGDNLDDILDDLVEKCPVARGKVGEGYWVVSRHKLVREIGQNWKTFSSANGVFPNRPEGQPFIYPEECDPPRHTSWRKVLNPFMTPKAVAQYDTVIRADANQLIDSFIDQGECEFISSFASKLPGWAFFKNVLGVPIEDLDKLVDEFDAGTFGPLEERAGHWQFLFEYLGQYLKTRSEQPPRGDMVDAIAAGVENQDGSPAPFEDRIAVLVNMCFGGISTTAYVMASGMRFLAENPDQLQRLLDNRDLVPRAVEEFARVFSPGIALARTCTQDVEIGGTQMKEGDVVTILYSASSRDPRVIDNPKTVDIGRETVLHSAFGIGPHRCVGSNLARVELRATFEEWLNRIPDFRVKKGTEPVYETGIVRNMKELHLVW